jgi:hypothetical protein
LNYSEQSARNDSFGEWYQDFAAKFFSKVLNEQLQANNGSWGIDLIFPSEKIEVKGVGSLLQQIGKEKERHSMRRWKINQAHNNRDTTLYAFVLYDEIFFPSITIFTIRAEEVHKRLDERSNSDWVHFSIGWVKERFVEELSRLPSYEGLE